MHLFILLSFAVWRVTALLVYDEGPRDVFVSLRKLSDACGGPLNCFWCTSVWVSFVASLLFLSGWKNCLLWWWALSGASIILDELIARRDA